jgi:hypothetical protein
MCPLKNWEAPPPQAEHNLPHGLWRRLYAAVPRDQPAAMLPRLGVPRVRLGIPARFWWSRRRQRFPDAPVLLGTPGPEKKGIALGAPVRAEVQKFANYLNGEPGTPHAVSFRTVTYRASARLRNSMEQHKTPRSVPTKVRWAGAVRSHCDLRPDAVLANILIARSSATITLVLLGHLGVSPILRPKTLRLFGRTPPCSWHMIVE